MKKLKKFRRETKLPAVTRVCQLVNNGPKPIIKARFALYMRHNQADDTFSPMFFKSKESARRIVPKTSNILEFELLFDSAGNLLEESNVKEKIAQDRQR